MRSLTIFFATGFYSGYAPSAPGTAGSLVGLVIWWLIFAPLWDASPAAAIALWAAIFVAGCFISGHAEIIFGQHDSSKIVIDEICGMIATMFFNSGGWLHLAIGFAAFRVFDILKPFPANQIDRRMGGGAGVMFDDLAAAIYANLVLQIASRLI